MKFKSTITKEVIDATLMCGYDETISVGTNCAYAYIINQLIPNVDVGIKSIFFKKKGEDTWTWYSPVSDEMQEIILHFDRVGSFAKSKNYKGCLRERYTLVGKECEFEIPDEVIEYWYDDVAKAAQKIANSNCLKMMESNV